MARAIEIECGHCGARFKRAPSNIKPGRQFCDSECYGKSKRRYETKAKSRSAPKQMMARHGLLILCQRCGYKEVPQILQVHHRDGDRTNNSSDNMEVLCPNCHALEHWRDGNKVGRYGDGFPGEIFDCPQDQD